MFMYICSTIQDGISPLYVASLSGHTGVVYAVLKIGADPNQVAKVQNLVCLSSPFCSV